MKTTTARWPSLTLRLGLLGLLLAGGGAAQAQTKSPKRGLAYDYKSAADLQALAPGTSWWYNYTSVPDAAVAGVYRGLGVEYVPIQWGSRLNNGTVTADQLAANIPAGAQYLMGFNEPNFRSQSNLTPTQAAAIWPVLQEVARRKNLKLVSPALNYCGDCVQENGVTYYSPTQYLDAFFAACPNCQVDYIALHTYVCEEQYLRQKVAEVKKYNKPIWLTEFACGDAPAAQITLAAQQKYMLDAVNYLENEPAIFRYSWFSGRNNEIPNINLLGADGQLTALGQQYASLPFSGPANELNRLAPVATAASSSESGTTGAANATDRNINSRWSSTFTDPQYLQLDFGAVQNFTRVKIAWETAYAKDYRVQTSLDGIAWGPLLTVLDSDGGVDDLTGLNGRGRYLRVYGTRRATAYGYSIYEVDAYGTADTALAAAQPGSPDAAPGLRLYPNPAATELHLALPGGALLRSLSVTDALGRTVLTSAGPAATLNIAALPAGLYVVRAATAREQFTQRFVKP